MKKQLLKTIAALAIFAASITAGHAQSFFTYIPDAAAGLKSDQTAKLATMRANRFYESVSMVQVANFATFQHDGHVTINLPGYAPLTAYASSIQAPFATLSNDFTWEGSFVEDVTIDGALMHEGDGHMTLYKKDGEMYGGIYPATGEIFELVSFEPGKNALIKYSNSAMSTVKECGSLEDEPTSAPPERTTGAPCNTKVRVLIVYTDEGENAIPSIPNAVNRAMGDLNGTINNCTNGGGNAKCYFELAGTYKLGSSSFTQFSSAYATLNAMAINPTILDKRDEYAADMVVYLSYGDFSEGLWGLANVYQISKPFAVVKVDVANANYTFAHEVGHVMGGRHQQHTVTDTQTDDDTPGEPHGYKFVRKKFTGSNTYMDIMHDFITGFSRSHVYSTPDIYYWSTAIGKAGTNDVTKTVFENVCAVSDIRSDTAIYFTATITAQTLASVGASVPLHCTPYNGDAPYTYQWQTSTDGDTWTTLSSQTDNATCIMPNVHHLYVLCYVMDVHGRKTVAFKTIIGKDYASYDPYSGQDAHLRAYKPANEAATMEIFPNPATDQVGVVITVPKAEANSPHTLVITDAVGKIVYSSVLASDTFIGVQIDLAKFASGAYFVKLLGTDTQTKKLSITK